MKIVLPELIHKNQVGFVQGINVAHNIRTILDIMNFTEDENMEAILIALDFEKAFDRVETPALVGKLKYFNFGEKFIKWTLL